MEGLREIDRYLIDMHFSIINSDMTSELSKIYARKYIESVLEKGAEEEKSYIIKKMQNHERRNG